MEKIIYYPGCIAESCSRQLDKATREVMKKLGIEYELVPEMNCCGSVNLRAKDSFLNLVMNGRNFALAEKLGLNIVTICNTCLNVMTDANKRLIEDSFLRQKVNSILKENNLHYSGGLKIKHLLWYLLEDYGIDSLRRQTQVDLAGLKVAPFYGCHIIRPQKLLGVDHQFDKNDLDVLITGLGANLTDHRMKYSCCGFHVHKICDRQVSSMTESIHASSCKAQANVIVTPCTECHYVLDLYAGKVKSKDRIPCLYFTQLLGLALGMNEKELELGKNFLSLKNVLQLIKGKKAKDIEPQPLKEEKAQSSERATQKDEEIDEGFDLDTARKKVMHR